MKRNEFWWNIKDFWQAFWFKDDTDYSNPVFGGYTRRRYSFRWQRLFNIFILILFLFIIFLLY